jgi:dihydrofolate synthase/folylpolyglutamate synthase
VDLAESESYLLSLGNEVSAMKLGLENIRKLLGALGDPHNHYLKVQIAGTNGKGSVCAFLESICLSAGLSTGLYMSPHLVSITERIRINGANISEDDFAKYATRVRDVSEKLVADGVLETLPTFFEQVTATALLAFADANVELAILETGLGGRLDATTAANAEIAAITRIDLDHQEYLGNSIEDIAGEKAAIIHEGSKVVIGEQSPAAMKVILARCAEVDVVPTLAESIKTVTKGGNTSSSECVSFETNKAHYDRVQLALLGCHQIENARIAILLAETLQERLSITAENIVAGLQNANHPGRLEWIGRYLLDGAHNAGGARALRRYLDEFVKTPIVLIFGALKGKDVCSIAEVLFPIANTVILTQPENSRAMSAREIAEHIPNEVVAHSPLITGSLSEALATANSVAEHDAAIVITGSLYLVGEAKKILNN